MRRLFSNFASGFAWHPAFWLCVSCRDCVSRSRNLILVGGPKLAQQHCKRSRLVPDSFLLAGYGRPIAGTLAAVIYCWDIFTAAGDLWTKDLLGTFCAALGPAWTRAWSVDARLFGWNASTFVIGINSSLSSFILFKGRLRASRNSGQNDSI